MPALAFVIQLGRHGHGYLRLLQSTSIASLADSFSIIFLAVVLLRTLMLRAFLRWGHRAASTVDPHGNRRGMEVDGQLGSYKGQPDVV